MLVSTDNNGYLIYGMRGSETDAEYKNLVETLKTKPKPIEGHEWKLKYPSFEWEAVEVEENPDIDDTEAFDIIFGGAE